MGKQKLFQWHVLVAEISLEAEAAQAVSSGIGCYGGWSVVGEKQGGERRRREKVILSSPGNQLCGPWEGRPPLPRDPGWPTCAPDTCVRDPVFPSCLMHHHSSPAVLDLP